MASPVKPQGMINNLIAIINKMKNVVYFDQQTGAPHAIHWSKSIFLMLKQLFPSLTEQKKKKKEKKVTQKHAIKGGLPAFRC